MALNIINTYIKPNGEVKKGNRPLFIILYNSVKSNYSIYDMDNDEKYNQGKKMFSGHFYITKDGRIFKGRAINQFGEFAYDEIKKMDFNVNSVGICVEGDYSAELMPENQKNSVVLLIKYLRKEYSTIRTIYSLDELISNGKNPGLLFPINNIVASSLNISVEPLRTAPNGVLRYAFKERTLYFDARKPITGNDVKELQIILNYFGFECEVNSIYDSFTLDAVINFQKTYNIIPDGVVGTKTFKLIKDKSKVFYEDKKTFNRILYVIAPNYLFGNDVNMLQTRLNLLGYPCTVSGFYDEETSNAVKNFQSVHSLISDGKVGPITWSQIVSVDFNFIKRILKYTMPMMFGDDIKLVQQRLNDIGYAVPVSGWYDENTQLQVSNFQKAKNLTITGEIDDKTSKLMFK